MCTISRSELTAKIVHAIREEAERQGIQAGAIGICYLPHRAGAFKWVGIIDGNELMEIIPIEPGGDYLVAIPGNDQEVDCFGIIGQKMAAASKAYHLGIGLCSSDLPEEYNAPGRINWGGCIRYPLGARIGGGCGFRGSDYIDICVAVSGGEDEEDHACALAAYPTIREWACKNNLICHKFLLELEEREDLQ